MNNTYLMGHPPLTIPRAFSPTWFSRNCKRGPYRVNEAKQLAELYESIDQLHELNVAEHYLRWCFLRPNSLRAMHSWSMVHWMGFLLMVFLADMAEMNGFVEKLNTGCTLTLVLVLISTEAGGYSKA